MSDKRTYSSAVAHNSSRYEAIWSSGKTIDTAEIILEEASRSFLHASANSCSISGI